MKIPVTFFPQMSYNYRFRVSLNDTPLLFTWLFVSALSPYINLHHKLQRHKPERHRQWGRKKMRNVLAIHSSDNLTADLLLVQSS